MSNKVIVLLVAAGVFILAGLLVFGSVMGTCNQEYALHTTITAKQTDNQNQMDKMWKTISQSAQVTVAQKEALVEIFKGYAQARSGDNKGGSLANWIHEAVPNVDTSTFNNLQNIIASTRDSFARCQTELLDLQREHNALFKPFPALSGFILHIFGRKEIEVVIVTSSRTKDAFKTGEDNDVNVFQK